MKKLLVLVSMITLSTFAIAGGDVSTKLSPVEAIPSKICKTDKVFIEEDVELMWQDQLYKDAEDGAAKQNKSAGKAGVWRHAEAYCRTLDYSGFADWRLPTSDELQKVHRIEGQVFNYFRGTDFWTSTPASKGRHYVVYPADAYIYERKSSRTNYIRCVRCLQEGDTEAGPALVK
ncbi:MAG: hypothetical protein DRG09_00675 [Epsilonproteobacteria bacterium]|nr:MAG: hypothetical protein DRG09_00675 [Campylobacterota bacterium]